MAGENMTLSWAGHSWAVKCTRIIYGPNIVSNEGSGQGGAYWGGFGSKAIYVRQYFLSTVGVTIIQSTWEDREAFTGWCVAYAKYVSSLTIPMVGMRIQGPRGFDYYGILTQGFGHSNTVQDAAYTMNLTFRGCQPTVKGVKQYPGGTSQAHIPTSLGGANSKFYPFEVLPSGPTTVQKALYDAPAPDLTRSQDPTFMGPLPS